MKSSDCARTPVRIERATYVRPVGGVTQGEIRFVLRQLAIVIDMRVHVDQEKCQGHNRCVALAPDLFEVDEYGTASTKNDGVVPPDRQEAAQLAVDNCPEYAITVTDA